MKGVTNMTAAIGSGVFTFIVFLMVTLFFCNNIVEGMPTWYQIVGPGTCLVVVALLAGFGSYRHAQALAMVSNMAAQLSTFPRLNVFKADGSSDYSLMEFVLADAGHYIAWGELRVMDRSTFVEQAQPFIEGSLTSFQSRDARDTSRRLKIKGREPFQLRHDQLAIQQISSSTLEIMPYSRGELQYSRLVESKIEISIGAAPAAFIAAIDSAFQCAAATRQS